MCIISDWFVTALQTLDSPHVIACFWKVFSLLQASFQQQHEWGDHAVIFITPSPNDVEGGVWPEETYFIDN